MRVGFKVIIYYYFRVGSVLLVLNELKLGAEPKSVII